MRKPDAYPEIVDALSVTQVTKWWVGCDGRSRQFLNENLFNRVPLARHTLASIDRPMTARESRTHQRPS
jgi:hypothetical protein